METRNPAEFSPLKARKYVLLALVCVSVCVCVCDHDNWKDCKRICTKFYGKVPRGKEKTKFIFRHDW